MSGKTQRDDHDEEEKGEEMSVPGLLTLHGDGSVSRLPDQQLPACLPCSKDVQLVLGRGISARLFLPAAAACKLPVLLFFHGGGFVSLSSASPGSHLLCSHLASHIPALVVSVDYRLAPEHRLPAAFDDGFLALQWLQKQAALSIPDPDPWLSSFADFSRCFLAGVSSGGAIVHQVALRAACCDWTPLNLRGLVMVVPFFGGEARTNSELQYGGNPPMLLEGVDKCWALSLPKGADRDHAYSNVTGAEAPNVGVLSWPPSLVLIGQKDLLHDRQLEYARKLQEAGKYVKLVIYEQGDHFLSGEFHNRKIEDIVQFVRTF